VKRGRFPTLEGLLNCRMRSGEESVHRSASAESLAVTYFPNGLSGVEGAPAELLSLLAFYFLKMRLLKMA